MERDRKRSPKKEEEMNEEDATYSMATDLETDKEMRTKEEDSDAPARNTRGSQRNRGEGGLSHDRLAADLEISRKRRKEKEDKSPVQRSRGDKKEEEDGDLTPKSRSSKRKAKEDGGELAPRPKRANKKGEIRNSMEQRWKQDVPDGISRLPHLAQDKIFEFLSLRDKARAARVCSAWKNAVYRPCHWRGLTPKVKLTSAIVSSLKNRQILGVKLDTSSKHLLGFLVELNTLESLSLSHKSTASLLERVSDERFLSLKNLVLHTKNECQIDRLRESLQCFPNLQSLTVDGVVTTGLLEVIGDELEGLASLKLVSREQDSRLKLEAVGQLIQLQQLELQSVWLEDLEVLIQLSSTLKELKFRKCDISEDDWTPVLSQVGSLNELEFVDCLPVLDSAGLMLLARSLPNLRKFTWGECRWGGGYRNSNMDDQMSAVAKMSGLQELHLLKGILVRNTGVLELCASLSDLRALTFGNSFSITTIEPISGLSSLTELRMDNCVNGRGWLKIFAAGSCKLQKLDLAFLHESDEGMGYLAQMSTLRDLSLRRVKMTAAGIAHLSKATFHLGALSVVICEVTVEDLIPLLQRQTSLKKLSLVEYKETPSTNVCYLKTILPHLEKCSVFNWYPKSYNWEKIRKRLK